MRRAAVLSLILGLGATALAADTPQPREPEKAPDRSAVPASLNDPAFDKYVEANLLARAWASADAELLSDLAIQMANGERVLRRPHRTLPADRLFGIALKAVAERRDADSLARLEQAAEMFKKDELKQRLAGTRDLLKSARAPDKALIPSADKSRDTNIQLYLYLDQIRAARVGWDATGLEDLEKTLEDNTHLTGESRAALKKLLAETRASLPKETDPTADLAAQLRAASWGEAIMPGYAEVGLNKLQGASRSGTSGTISFTLTNNTTSRVQYDMSVFNGGTAYLSPGTGTTAPYHGVSVLPNRSPGIYIWEPTEKDYRFFSVGDNGSYEFRMNGSLIWLYTLSASVGEKSDYAPPPPGRNSTRGWIGPQAQGPLSTPEGDKYYLVAFRYSGDKTVADMTAAFQYEASKAVKGGYSLPAGNPAGLVNTSNADGVICVGFYNTTRNQYNCCLVYSQNIGKKAGAWVTKAWLMDKAGNWRNKTGWAPAFDWVSCTGAQYHHRLSYSDSNTGDGFSFYVNVPIKN
jgi:hypothetical protein